LPDNADVAELVDALDLGSSAERRGGSSPFIRTNQHLGISHYPFPVLTLPLPCTAMRLSRVLLIIA
jgi:hypothetical protein